MPKNTGFIFDILINEVKNCLPCLQNNGADTLDKVIKDSQDKWKKQLSFEVNRCSNIVRYRMPPTDVEYLNPSITPSTAISKQGQLVLSLLNGLKNFVNTISITHQGLLVIIHTPLIRIYKHMKFGSSICPKMDPIHFLAKKIILSAAEQGVQLTWPTNFQIRV